MIVEQGKMGVGLFIIVKGAVEVVRARSDGTSFVVDKLGPTQFFGELSLLDEAPRTARSSRWRTPPAWRSPSWTSWTLREIPKWQSRCSRNWRDASAGRWPICNRLRHLIRQLDTRRLL
jgi:hypothetical protein